MTNGVTDNVTDRERQLLQLIIEDPGYTMPQLAERMSVSRKTAAGYLKRLKEKGIINLLAGVAYVENEDEYLSHDSCKFHENQGYTEVAHMKTVGRKFDRWYDLLWYQKKI